MTSYPVPRPPWQQYRCSGCGWHKRVRIAPSKAPSSIRTGCERCGTQQCHRVDETLRVSSAHKSGALVNADGGSGVI